MTEELHDLDNVFNDIGGFGWYQYLLVFFRQWQAVSISANLFVFFVLSSIKPTVSCFDPGFNSTDECFIRKHCSNVSITSVFRTYVEDFGLVCEYTWLAHLITSITVSAAFMTLITGVLADQFGRRWLVVGGFLASIAAGVIAAFSTNWSMLLVLLIIQGLSQAFCENPQLTLLNEKVTKKFRSIIACSNQWCIIAGIDAIVAYLTGNWRYFLLFCNGISAPLMLLFLGMAESPRWLIQKGRLQEAAKSLNWIAKINRCKPSEPITEELLQKYRRPDSERHAYPYLELLKSKHLLKHLVLQMLHALIVHVGISVILWNVSALFGNPFCQLALSGLLRLWAPFLFVFVDWKVPKFGRRWTLLVSLAFIICCFVALTFIFAFGKQTEWQLLVTVLSQSGALTIVSIFLMTCDLYNVELFPTVARGAAASVMTGVGLAGQVLTPQLLYLASFWPATPYLVVSLNAVISWTMDWFLLPETHGKPLLESVGEVNHLSELSGKAKIKSVIKN